MKQEVKLIEKKAKDHSELVGIEPFIAQLLVDRGIDTLEKADMFLNAQIDDVEELYNPAKIKDIDRVFETLMNSIKNKEKIYIFGDYDVDGITSTAIMYLTLKDLNADVNYRLPDRLTEGYGMTCSAVEELYHRGCDLIITVDNGIKCHEEVALAKRLGMKVIILDHHTPGATLPDADVVIDLYCEGETYPYKDLAGCGLVFKVSCYLYEQFGFSREEGYKHIDLAAIGTVADVVPLVEENRIIVREGLRFLNHPDYNRIGILAIMEEFGVERGSIHSMDIGFRIAPAMNAPGRLYKRGADKALELVLTEDEAEAQYLSFELFNINEERKERTQESLRKAEEYIEAYGIAKDKVMVVLVPDVPEGVVGLVSGRITEKYHRPSLVFSEGRDYYKASARSIEEFDLYKGLCTCDDLFIKYGGHPQAAGMSIEKDISILHELRKRLNEYADKVLTEEDIVKKIYIDRIVKSENIDFELVEKISVLEPFGQKNPKPIFFVENYRTIKKLNGGAWLPYLFMGKERDHLKLYGEKADAIGFSMVSDYEALGKPKVLDIAFTLGINRFMGRESLQLEMLYFKQGREQENLKEEKETELMSAMNEAIEEVLA